MPIEFTMQAHERPDRAASFYRALQLAERCRSLRDEPFPAIAGPAPRRRYWQEVPGLADQSSPARRRAAEGIGAAEFDRALAETAESIRDRWPETPPWLTALREVYGPGTATLGTRERERWPLPPLPPARPDSVPSCQRSPEGA